jgi:hypothetical protein
MRAHRLAIVPRRPLPLDKRRERVCQLLASKPDDAARPARGVVFAAPESLKRLDRNVLVVLQLYGRRFEGVGSIEYVVDVGKQSSVDVAIKRSSVDASERQGGVSRAPRQAPPAMSAMATNGSQASGARSPATLRASGMSGSMSRRRGSLSTTKRATFRFRMSSSPPSLARKRATFSPGSLRLSRRTTLRSSTVSGM